MPELKNLKKKPAVVNRQAVGTYQGKLHQRRSGAYGQGTPEAGKRQTAKSAVVPAAPSDEINKVVDDLRDKLVAIDTLVPDPENARQHPEQNLEAIKASLVEYGQRKPIVVRKETMIVVAGNGTLEAAKALGWTHIAASIQPMTDAEAAGYGLADNRTAELATWNFEVVRRLDKLLQDDSKMIGWTPEILQALRAERSDVEPPPTLNLSDRFIIPPFSVLDARQGYWQERKRAWLGLGIQSELGRGDTPSTSARVGPDDPATYRTIGGRKVDNGLLGEAEQARSHYRMNAAPGGSPRDAATLGADGRTVRGDGKGRRLAATFGSGGPGDLAAGFKEKQSTLGAVAPNQGGADGILTRTGRYAAGGAQPLYGAYRPDVDDDTSRRNAAAQPQSGTSIFDPVLCELAYRWFSPPTGVVFDPFAGGSVRGIVAAKLGRQYAGIDLRPEQAAANEEQAARITPTNPPKWVVGDALDTEKLQRLKRLPRQWDLVFSCPPYADLERYSDDPRDLSTMPYEAFLDAYRRIIAMACAGLRNNRFACVCVGDVRRKDAGGVYRNFVSDTIAAFGAAGLGLYNEAILVTAVGSLPIRVGRQFSAYRKLGKTHQNVLVFLKGDPGRAVKDCGPVDVTDLEKLLSAEEPEAGVADE